MLIRYSGLDISKKKKKKDYRWATGMKRKKENDQN
jgi:hypothetical protein